jgi:hypothetical protein
MSGGRVKLTEQCNDITENRNGDLPASGIVSRPIALQRAPGFQISNMFTSCDHQENNIDKM